MPILTTMYRRTYNLGRHHLRYDNGHGLQKVEKETGNRTDEQNKTIFALFKNPYLDTDKLYFYDVPGDDYFLLSGLYEKGL